MMLTVRSAVKYAFFSGFVDVLFSGWMMQACNFCPHWISDCAVSKMSASKFLASNPLHCNFGNLN